MTTDAAQYHFDDFTESSYERILRTARERYSFEPFGTEAHGPHVLWRHDIDFSVHRARRLARIESDLGLRATYFLLLHSPYYSLLEAEVRDAAIEIAALGHPIGLHFDASYYPEEPSLDELESQLARERELLAEITGAEIDSFAFHIPGVTGTEAIDAESLGGMVNAGARSIRERYSYVSDSNGIWRHRRLPEVIDAGEEERLHVLTHPAWWTPDAMSPRDRLKRCIDGRAVASAAWYDDLVAAWGRENIR